ncbi:ABC transporter ATP-binding protein [Pseudooceanicola algae]|uniref:High-affinity branched-chain amino acid transport ATP-binding protein LivF n=1 Tax=Pseudooceanicola algae TaxID=1537215 RepID=A0A418SJ19_9RHOB|nr:ABC transporter ATP-binding protein [Pseudooceanicola algae]QPM91996.1 High-affinity branched-chain amino acid transport ATP-binding protein LivF [Pseudooceanicola algae]
MLELKGINVHYGSTQVLWDVSMSVGRGEIVSVMGPNGSGKSTVLKAAMGLKKASSGAVILNGTDLQGKSATTRPRQGMSIVLERRRLFPRMSVRENILLGAFTRPQKDARRAFDEVLDTLPDLKPHLNATAGKLSGGQQQMVAIARGLMADPRVLLMDEPFLGLSPIMVKTVSGIMKSINERGVAILFNEQNAKLSFALSHRGYLLESGRVVLSGSGEEMLDHPEVKRVYLGVGAAAK